MWLRRLLSNPRVGIRAALIGGAVAIIAAVLGATIPILLNKCSNGALELSSVSVVERDFFPVLDVKLRNTSDKPVVLTRVEIETFDASPVVVGSHTSPPLATSHRFSLLLDPLKDAQHVSEDVAFEVQPKRADRFQIILAVPPTRVTVSDLLTVVKDSKLRKELIGIKGKPEELGLRLKGVVFEARLLLHFDRGEVLKSEHFKAHIRIDEHFVPGKRTAILALEQVPSEQQPSGIAAQSDAELIELVGFFQDTRFVPELEKALFSSNIDVVVEAAVALSKVKNSKGEEKLLALVKDAAKPSYERTKALRGLIRVGHWDADLYLQVLNRKERALALETVRVLAALKEKRAVPGLLELLRNREEVAIQWMKIYLTYKEGDQGLVRVRRVVENRDAKEIVFALGHMRDPKIIPDLVDLIYNKETYREQSYTLLRAAIWSLGNTADPKALPVLRQVLKVSLELPGFGTEVAEACRKAIAKIEKKRSPEDWLSNVDLTSESARKRLIYEREKDDLPFLLIPAKAGKQTHTAGKEPNHRINTDQE
ncbi:MAG TPA: HEAT repeat domain-containing protein [Candidatus Nanoarchaeia archaeon]